MPSCQQETAQDVSSILETSASNQYRNLNGDIAIIDEEKVAQIWKCIGLVQVAPPNNSPNLWSQILVPGSLKSFFRQRISFAFYSSFHMFKHV